MRFKKAIIAALAVSMTATPVLAQSAASLSVASSVSRVGATTQNESAIFGDNDGYLLPGIVLIAILAAAILLSKDNKTPASP